MATDIRSLPAFISTDADFRTWVAGLQAQLAVTGLVHTSDTGQINAATVLKPAAVGTFQGYDIWRFDDALQTTLPVFIKIEYGAGNPIDKPSLAFTVGTGTNGAGTITGQIGARKVVVPNQSKTAGILASSYCSGSPSRLSLATHLDSGSIGTFTMTALIERPKTSAGVETADGICTLFVSAASGQSQLVTQIIPAVGSIPTFGGGTGPFGLFSSMGGVPSLGVNVALLPAMVPIAGKLFFMSVLSYIHTDIAELGSFSCLYLGANHTFMPLGDGGPNPGGSQMMAMLWE